MQSEQVKEQAVPAGSQQAMFQAPKKKGGWKKVVLVGLVVAGVGGAFLVRTLMGAGKELLSATYLTEAAQLLHYDLCWLSRQLKQKTGKTYTQLAQEKRLAQAAFLLRSTDRNVADISVAVGYENISYFHRIFAAAYGKSPKHYRDDAHLQERTLF